MSAKGDELIIRRALTALEQIEALGCTYHRFESVTKRCIGAHPCASCIAHRALNESRNWNPDCDEHGLASDWWKSPEQIAKREAQNERLRDLQAQAKAARMRALREETPQPWPKN